MAIWHTKVEARSIFMLFKCFEQAPRTCGVLARFRSGAILMVNADFTNGRNQGFVLPFPSSSVLMNAMMSALSASVSAGWSPGLRSNGASATSTLA